MTVDFSVVDARTGEGRGWGFAAGFASKTLNCSRFQSFVITIFVRLAIPLHGTLFLTNFL